MEKQGQIKTQFSVQFEGYLLLVNKGKEDGTWKDSQAGQDIDTGEELNSYISASTFLTEERNLVVASCKFCAADFVKLQVRWSQISLPV